MPNAENAALSTEYGTTNMSELKNRKKIVITACAIWNSWLERVTEAATQATFGEVVLLRPASSSEGSFEKQRISRERFCRAAQSIGSGGRSGSPN